MDIIKTLIKFGKKAVKDELVIGSGGNISILKKDQVIIKAKGVSLNSSSIKDYVLSPLKVGADQCVRPEKQPSSEIAFHQACYRQRKDIKAVIHVHPVFSTAVANAKIRLGAVSYELSAILCSSIIRAKYESSGSKSLAKEIARCIKGHNAILMPNHGLLTVGEDLSQAYLRAVAAERACQTLIGAKILGGCSFLPKKEAKRIERVYNK